MYNFMEELITKLKKWGNSYGVLLPKRMIERQKLKADTDIVVSIKPHKSITAGELLEFAKIYPLKSKKRVEETMKEIDYELYRIKR